MSENNLVEIEIELDNEDLEFIEKHHIDFSALVREKMDKLRAEGDPLKSLKVERFKLKTCIEDCQERLEEVEEEIKLLESKETE